jgi:hypothetical protein
MILEVAILDVKPGLAEEFEAALPKIFYQQIHVIHP